VIKWVGDPTGLKPVADALLNLGKITKEQYQEFIKTNNEFKKRGAEAKKQTEAQRKLNQETRKGRKGIEEMAAASKKLPVNIKSAGAATRTLGKSMMNLGRQIASAFGIVTVVATFVMGIKNAISVNAAFEKQMARVKAITGATGAEFQKLEKDAKRLGSSTKFTATQVGTLQEAFGKLGFSTQEILSATEATLLLAEATGSDLSQAADVAGATVRAFGLDASETERVVDVMAKSFTSSALGIENFSEAMKFVAPVAKAANIDIETTTALLGKLADSNLRGSIAGTGLKNLLSKLSDENSSLAKELGFAVKNSDDLIRAFKELQKGNIDLTKATELTDERSKAAFLTLIQGIDGVEDLRDALNEAAGSAEGMAEIMRDTFSGDVDKAASAWEGLLLTMEGTDTARGFVQGLTDVIGGLDITIQKLKGTYKQLQQEQGLDEAFKQGEKRAANFQRIMGESIEDQDRLLKELNDEIERASRSYDELFSEQEAHIGQLDEVNEQYDQYDKWLTIMPKSIKQKKAALEGTVQAEDEALESLLAYMDALEKYAQSLKAGGGGATDGTEEYIRSIQQLSKELKKYKTSFKEAEIGSAGWIKSIKDMEDKTRELAKAQKLAADTLKEYRSELDQMSSNDDQIEAQNFSSGMNEEYKRIRDEMYQKSVESLTSLSDLEKMLALESIDNEEDRASAIFDIETNRINGMIELGNKFGKDTSDLQLQQAERFRNLKDQEVEDNKKAEEAKRKETVKTSEEQKEQMKQQAAASLRALGQLFSTFSQISNSTIEAELQQQRILYEKGEITREEFEKKRKKAAQEKASNDRAANLFSAIVNTAAGVTEALPNVPLSVAVGLLGAAQITAIASQPIPQFAKGTKAAPAGFKWVGEEGAELVYDGGGYPIITHKESKVLTENPESSAANTIRKKYSIPEMDASLVMGGRGSFQLSDKALKTGGGRDSLNYDLLGKAVAKHLSGSDRRMLRSLQKSRELDAMGYESLLEALGSIKTKRRGYA